MLKSNSNIVAKISKEIFTTNPSLIRNIPKGDQEAWQVNLALRTDLKLIHEVNMDLITPDMAKYLFSNIKKKPTTYLYTIQYIPKKYHTAGLANFLVDYIKKLGPEGQNTDYFVEYIAYLRGDLITLEMLELIQSYGLMDIIQRISPQIANKFTRFKPFNKDIKRTYIPKNLDKIQVIILRYMRNNDLDVITVPQLKKANLVTPDTEKMIQFYKGKPLTIKDIISYKMENSKDGELFNYIKKNLKSIYMGKHNAIQRIFKKKPNHIFGLIVTNAKAIYKDYPDLTYALGMTHFESPIKNTILLGWVRYTKFEKDIWIDEVQSDIINNSGYAEILKTDAIKIYDLILNEFIRNMHRRGSNKIFIPTYEVKTQVYDGFGEGLPPKYVYSKLPKKFKFKKDTVENIDDKVDGLNTWILASVKNYAK